MYKTVILAVTGIVLGAVGGVGFSTATMQQKLDDARSQALTIQGQLAEASARLAGAEERAKNAGRIDADTRDAWEREKLALERKIAELEAAASALPPVEMAEADPFEGMAPGSDAMEGERGPGRNREDGEREGRRREPTPEERAEWEARREEMVATARDRQNQFMADSIAKADTPEEAARLALLQDNMNAMANMMEQYRELETDEEREAYREAMAKNRDNIQSLVREQQDDMMRDVAKSYGITDRAKQDEFVSAMRDTQSNPMFRSPAMTMGGGGGRGGGWGGGGFGGGGFGGGGGGRGGGGQ